MVIDSWSITTSKRGWSLNAERRMHFHQRHKLVDEWKLYFQQAALDLEIPRYEAITVEAFTTLRTRALQDCGNNYPAIKAAIDGIVLAGVIDDDTPAFLHAITIYAPVYVKGVDSLCLKISPC